MESLLKNLKQHVTCPICLDNFTDPKTITCLHTFCCECLKQHALISQRNGKFRCPECQAEVGLPEANRFDKLPTSFYHNSLLSLLAAGNGNEISCGICTKKSAEIQNVSYCFECAKFMCSDCVNAHELFRNTALTEGHKVTPVKQFQAEDYKALMKRQPVGRVEGLILDFQAGVEAKFMIRPRIHEEQVYEVKYKFDVEVLVEPADKVGSLTTCENEDGDFLVKFTPKVPGTFNITVKINGEKFATSPYTIRVKERLIQVVGELELKGETLQSPFGIAVSNEGLIAVADAKKHCILIFDNDGKFVRKLGCYGNNAGQLNRPLDVTFLNDDNILVADELNHRIQQFNVHTGNSVKSFGKKGTRDGEFQKPVGLCMDGEGRVVVADCKNSRVQVLSEDGAPVFKFGDSGPGKLDRPTACIHHQDYLIVTDWGNDCLKAFDNSGKFLYNIGVPGEGDGQLNHPWRLCLEKCGNHYNLLVFKRKNGRVSQFTVEGCFTGKTVDKLQDPAAITTTPDGRILVSDYEAKKIYILK